MTVDHAVTGDPAQLVRTATPAVRRRSRARHARPLFTPGLVSWAIAALGLALRLREYLANPSIWSDEAEVALNIIDRSYAGLTHPLVGNQGAPIGFLFLEKTAVELFGPSGPALRLVPFVASLVLVVVFRSLAMRTLGGWAGCVATLLVAVSPALVYYSTDTKQYSGDAMAVVVLAWMAVRAIERNHRSGSLLVWGITSALLVWLSFPAVFAAGCGAIVLLVAARKSRPDLMRTAAAGALWVVSFLVEYFVSLRTLHANGALLAFWSYALAPSRGSKLAWAYHVTDGVLHDPLGLIVAPLAFVLLVTGAVGLLKERFSIGLFCVLLCGVTLSAGLVREYPVADRLVLYLVPIASLLLGGTLLLFRRFRIAVIGLIVLVTASTFSSAAIALAKPYVMTSGRDAFVYALDHAGPHDIVLIEGSATDLYDFYHRVAGVNVAGNVYLVAAGPGAAPCSPTQETAGLRRYRHLWVVFAPPGTFEPPSALSQYVNALGAAGTTKVVVRYPGDTAVIEVDTAGRADGATSLPPPSWQSGTRGCLSVYLYAPQSH